jgi:hypothetical protein
MWHSPYLGLFVTLAALGDPGSAAIAAPQRLTVQGYFAPKDSSPAFMRRYHPVRAGFSQTYACARSRDDFDYGQRPFLRAACGHRYRPCAL